APGLARARRRVRDRGAAGRLHRRDLEARAVDGAGQLDRDDLVPAVDRVRGARRRRSADSGIVDRDVKRAEALRRLRDERLVVARARDIGAEEEGFGPAGLETPHGLVAPRLVDIRDDDSRAGGRKLLSDRAADAAAGARDDRNLVLEHLRPPRRKRVSDTYFRENGV